MQQNRCNLPSFCIITANPLYFAWRHLQARWQCWLWGRQHRLGIFIKRAFDVLVASTLLILAIPLFILVIVLIRLDSPGNLLFSQERIGYYGKRFRMWKFRSMYIDAEARKAELMAKNEAEGGVVFKMKQDPRITRVGRYIRKLSVDELPQLWNVLNGTMSLVGPRPPLYNEVLLYTPYQLQRLLTQPGITCIWQVSGRSELPFVKQVALDIEYIATRSLVLDFWLLVRTVPAVLKCRGAY